MLSFLVGRVGKITIHLPFWLKWFVIFSPPTRPYIACYLLLLSARLLLVVVCIDCPCKPLGSYPKSPRHPRQHRALVVAVEQLCSSGHRGCGENLCINFILTCCMLVSLLFSRFPSSVHAVRCCPRDFLRLCTLSDQNIKRRLFSPFKVLRNVGLQAIQGDAKRLKAFKAFPSC